MAPGSPRGGAEAEEERGHNMRAHRGTRIGYERPDVSQAALPSQKSRRPKTRSTHNLCQKDYDLMINDLPTGDR